MPRLIGRILLLACVATAAPATGYELRPGRDRAAQQALDELNSWLGDTPAAEGWRKYLHLGNLKAQLAQGAKADANQVRGTLERLESGVQGLDRPQFARLRDRVAQWRATLEAPTLDKLPELVDRAKQEYRPADVKVLAADRTRVGKAAAALARFLGEGKRGRDWRAYLRWEALEAQLKPHAQPSVEQLDAVLAQLRADKVGLDLPQFTNLATALTDYLVVVRESQNPKAREEYETVLGKLSETLAAYSKEPSAERLKHLGVQLDWLGQRRQALPLIESITYQISRPNLHVVVAGKFLNDGLGRDIDETAPVRDTILGTRIVGTGRTRGDVSFRLIPNADVAMLEATLEGVNQSRNVGYNGPAIISSVGTTRLLATKWLTIDIDGIHGLPVTASADASTTITGIGSSKRGIADCLITRIASKRVPQQKNAAESVAEQHAEERLNVMFEERIGQELTRSNQQFRERFRNPLVRRGQLPHVFFSTSSDHLYVTALQASGRQLGAQTIAPEIVGAPEISLRLHQSLVNNVAGGTLAGQTVGQPELEKFAKDFFGEVPERLKPEPGKEAWSITFADEDPIIFKVADGGVSLTGRGKKYTSGNRSFPAMNFTVSYKLEAAGQGIKATRNGDIEILPPNFVQGGGKRLSLPQTTLRQLMTRRLNKIFESEIVKSDAIELKGEWKDAGPLEVTNLDSQSEWLCVGLQQVRHPAAAKSTLTTASR